jgi:3',5'-cyclic-AMP phosphodiesterase
MLEQAVARIDALEPVPELVLVTGDITDDDGTPEAYAAARARLDRLPCPYRLLAGNHDHRDNLREAFLDSHPYLQGSGFLHHAFDVGPLHVIALDTLGDPGDPVGRLCDERLDWVAQTLDSTDRPILIAMHHQPITTGLVHLDRVGCAGAGRLGELIEGGNVVAVICGHVHRPVTALWHGVPVIVAPAAGYQFPLHLVEQQGPGGFVLEPPGMLLHLWLEEESRLVTHLLPTAESPFHPFGERREP